MHGRDPLPLALALMTLFTLAVGVALALALRSSPEAVAGGLVGGPQVTVRAAAQMVTVRVEPGASAAEIARDLEAAGVIGGERRFNLLLEFTGWGPELRAGRYEFERGTPALEVIRRLREGLTNERLFTVPEGLRLEEIGELLGDEGVASIDDWEQALRGPRPEQILETRPEGASLLGYLLPASYPLGGDTTADDLVAAMIAALAEQLTDELLAEAEDGGHSLHDLLTLASIVEKEAVEPDEQPLIASVFLNRLDLGVALQADPTVQFAAASNESGGSGWWPEIFEVDLERDSPYNTYRYPGLPPGPIANPGIGAIIAVIRPASTEYLYFVARCDGSERHDFGETLDQHMVNVARCHGE